MKQKICIGILAILLIIFMVLTFYYRNKYVKFEASAYEGNKNLYQDIVPYKVYHPTQHLWLLQVLIVVNSILYILFHF